MYELVPLKFSSNALEPSLSETNIDEHYYTLYKNYKNKLNSLMIANDLKFIEIEYLLYNLENFDPKIAKQLSRYGGGYANHTLFFESLIPTNYFQTADYTVLDSEIDKQFGSKNDLKLLLEKNLLSIFSNGWTFLVADNLGNLKIINTKDQLSPLTLGYYPLIALDMWEHSYYFDYLSDKFSYASNLIELIDFKSANIKYLKSITFFKNNQ